MCVRFDADDLCAVDQVRGLLIAYEGYNPNETEMELRARLNEYIGAVTLFG